METFDPQERETVRAVVTEQLQWLSVDRDKIKVEYPPTPCR